MHLSSLFILLVVVALFVGPLVMLRPSPAQKKKEILRSFARLKGLHFSVRNLPQQATQQEKPAPVSVYFFPPSKATEENSWMLVRTTYEHSMHFLGYWDWQNNVKAKPSEQQILTEFLPSLPSSVVAVSSGMEGVCVYWDESDGMDVLEKLVHLLEALRRLDAINING